MAKDALRTLVIDWLDDNYHFGEAADLITDDGLSFLKNGILDSLGFVQLVLFLEDELHLEIDRSELAPENFDGMGLIVAYLEAHPDFHGVPG
jgi:acyl carrier protein